MSLAELEALIDDLYKFICDTLANEKLSSTASALRESLKHRIHLCRGASPAFKSVVVKRIAEPPTPSPTRDEPPDHELPDYGGGGEEMAEYEEFEQSNAVMLKNKQIELEVVLSPSAAPLLSAPTITEEVTVQSLVNSALMHGPLFRKERIFLMNRKCWAAATATIFHLFNSETDVKPVLSVRLDELRVNIPQKDKKKDVLFELVAPANKSFKFAAPSLVERDKWVSALGNGNNNSSLQTPAKISQDSHSPSANRSQPETPFEMDQQCAKIEEDTSSLDNYEFLDAANGDVHEDIYNSLEDIQQAVKQQSIQMSNKPLPPPPPPARSTAPALPKSRRPQTLVTKKPMLSPQEQIYDDTGNTEPEADYDDGGAGDDFYDDAGAARTDDDEQDMYYDIAELQAKTADFPPPPLPPALVENEVIYDDTEPSMPPPPVDEEPQDEYDEVGPVTSTVNVTISFKPEVIKKLDLSPTKQGPPPPSQANKSSIFRNLSLEKPQVTSPPAPPANQGGFLFRMQRQSSSVSQTEEYDEVGPPLPVNQPLSAELSNALKNFKLKQTTQTKPVSERKMSEDLSDPNTVKSRLASLRPVGAKRPTSPPPKPMGVAKRPTSPPPKPVANKKPSSPPAKPKFGNLGTKPAVSANKPSNNNYNNTNSVQKPPPPVKKITSNFEQKQNIFKAEEPAESKTNVKDLIQRMGGKV
ncbi:probable LIM domain-containing serine/threonine-protein kinase DDB_G0286997 [Neocloeon triangulifer]|uniref:probable LIM domain-containing serine/threonine-protein kinase DDB_G0286997 n=1 Tax=Neocloeon triangulifer TaxID=2078957 RepID=UPI00286F20F2|nr:probable LIM domain-containing serine/threonine-protein kinase DDB_G0286997 [Neocloeon triangulifer]